MMCVFLCFFFFQIYHNLSHNTKYSQLVFLYELGVITLIAMWTIMFRYDDTITLDEEDIKYIDGQSAISSIGKETTPT